MYDTLERLSEIQYNSNGGNTFSTADADGNPLTVGEDISLTWTQGRRLARYTLYGDVDIEFTYNSDGIRTRKTVEGITHYYTLDGSRILSEEWTTGAGSNAVRHLMVYVYDASGSPIGFRYRNSTESERVFHQYIYGKNIQGDILYIFGLDGTLYASYVYDAWGKQSVTYYNSGNNNNLVPGVKYNPFTYRGYYYDSETGFYYVSSRYYDPEIGRWINTDDAIAGVGGDIRGYNLFAYCMNDPVNMSDHTGHWPQWIKNAASAVVNAVKKAVTVVANTVKSAVSSASNILKASSNSLPKKGDPGSSQTLPNPDGTPKQKRWYGPDGNPERDRDYNHPGNMPFPHDHEWKNGERGKEHLPPDPSYKMSWEPVIGAGLVVICTVGIIAVAADDLTGVGVADDFLFGPLGAGVGEGLIMIFG